MSMKEKDLSRPILSTCCYINWNSHISKNKFEILHLKLLNLRLLVSLTYILRIQIHVASHKQLVTITHVTVTLLKNQIPLYKHQLLPSNIIYDNFKLHCKLFFKNLFIHISIQKAKVIMIFLIY